MARDVMLLLLLVLLLLLLLLLRLLFFVVSFLFSSVVSAGNSKTPRPIWTSNFMGTIIAENKRFDVSGVVECVVFFDYV